MAADGSIVIDTRIDQKGFNAGIKNVSKGVSSAFNGLLNVAKNIGKTLVGAFIGGAIINAIRGLVGSFDFMSSSIGDKLKPLADAFDVLKGTLVNLIATALVPLIPYIVMAVQWLTSMLQIVTQVVAALFGFESTVGSIMSTTASNAKKATKEAKGTLAAFDQISVLQTPQAANDTTGGGLVTPEALTISKEIQKIVDDILNKFRELKDFLVDLFNNPLKILELLDTAWKAFIAWVRENLPFGNLIADVLEVIGSTFKKLFINFLETFLAVKERIIQIFQGIKDFITGILTGDWELAWEGLKNIVLGIFGAIGEIIKGALEHFAILFSGLGEILKIVLQPLLEIFAKLFASLREGFGMALEWIGNKFRTIFEGVQSFVKGIINTIIDYINTMIRSIVSGINSIVIGANAVGALVPGFSPLSTVTAPQIPRLATGAVIPPNAEFAAILGDQRSGKNIEAPESLIRQIVREETANQQMGISVRFDGNLGELVRQLKPVIERENIRTGGSLIKGITK